MGWPEGCLLVIRGDAGQGGGRASRAGPVEGERRMIGGSSPTKASLRLPSKCSPIQASGTPMLAELTCPTNALTTASYSIDTPLSDDIRCAVDSRQRASHNG